ncbi:hypothetical protein FRB94_004887 [Tulasnella sp. JGI-2019a]|nr:hypothetical protein FRB93_005822 [Tulasnella sp. JGI-2019a]KAG9001234.1 hypothetical protein FRB94_004887 [Tulasnella sp. JGI-2019a]KAG9024269.1 hypothetical protein FRB95_011727 [Tulasnella sp. JGI-2019a]
MPPPSATNLPAKLLSELLPSSPLLKRRGSLYRVLSILPKDGVGAKVTQARWEHKGIPNSYWEITRVRLRNEGKNGKAWGRLVWKGRQIHEQDTMIPRGLKYTWKEFAAQDPTK